MHAYIRTAATFSTIIFLVLPLGAQAAVLINEVAWMGTNNSANDEWIELYNDGATPVALDGWELTDSTSLSVVLSGTLSAGAYAVLERTDDTSAPGSAFFIYTGALGNDGRTLTLKDASGAIHDQVVGGENWESIGGDNATKETAQLTSGGWITAAATPGAKNQSAASPSQQNSTSETVSGSSSSGSGSSESTTSGDVNLRISVPKSITGYVNNPVPFSVTVRGVPESRTKSLRYRWNFGDGMTSSDNNPEHRYRFPGTYVVVIEVSYARHVARERITVTVLPFTVSLELIGGNVLLHNNAEYEVDISGMKISDGTNIYTFPQHTILLPNATLTLSKHVTGFGRLSFATIFDARGNTVARAPSYNVAGEDTSESISEAGDLSKTVAASISETQHTISPARDVQEKSPELTAAVGDAETDFPKSALMYTALAAIMLIAVLALYANRLV